jgi:hypothetical protein
LKAANILLIDRDGNIRVIDRDGNIRGLFPIGQVLKNLEGKRPIFDRQLGLVFWAQRQGQDRHEGTSDDAAIGDFNNPSPRPFTAAIFEREAGADAERSLRIFLDRQS